MKPTQVPLKLSAAVAPVVELYCSLPPERNPPVKTYHGVPVKLTAPPLSSNRVPLQVVGDPDGVGLAVGVGDGVGPPTVALNRTSPKNAGAAPSQCSSNDASSRE